MADVLSGPRRTTTPAPQPRTRVFSPLQYGAHVSGTLRVAGDRLSLGKEQDSAGRCRSTTRRRRSGPPTAELDAGELADELESERGRVSGSLASMDPSEWTRTVINDRGRYGVYSFTLAGIARNAVHESHHHLLDAKGTLAPGATP